MLVYQSYKGRSINVNIKAMVYKNLHNGMFSIRQNGLVVAHVDSVVLSPALFKVNQSGRQRVLVEKKKNVHAFVVGYIEAVNVEIETSEMTAVSYNPYKFNNFYIKSTEESVNVLGYCSVYCSTSKGLFVA